MPAKTSTVTFYPSVHYQDVDAGMEWLERTLGFERREDHRDEDGNCVHAEMTLGGSILMLGTAEVGREPFRSIPHSPVIQYVAVDDVEPFYERARAAGADIALEITDTDYGSRDFTVRDPEGNLWSFGTYRPVVEEG